MLVFIFADNSFVEIAGRVQLLETGDLLIAAVKPNDAGKYTCVRANEAGSVNASAYLTVVGKQIQKKQINWSLPNVFSHLLNANSDSIVSTVRTQIIRPPSDTSVLLGHTAELQCKISNDPSVPYDIVWLYNSQ